VSALRVAHGNLKWIKAGGGIRYAGPGGLARWQMNEQLCPLILRCVECESDLGPWRRGASDYRCIACGSVYSSVNGVLNVLPREGARACGDLQMGSLSSFAKTTTDRMDWEALVNIVSGGMSDGVPERSRLFLDIGCGYGALSTAAAKKFGLVVGIDADLGQLESVPELLKGEMPQNLVLVRAFAEKLPFRPGQFHAVTCVQTLEHVGNPDAAIGQIRLMLAPGGRLFLSVPNRFTLRAEPHTNLRGIGYLPKWLAERYAAALGKAEEFRSLHFFSAGQVSALLRAHFGTSWRFIRSGCHHTALGRLAARAWGVAALSPLIANVVGDIEVIAWL